MSGWAVADDAALLARAETDSTADLAAFFSRSEGSVKARLAVLQDPKHKAAKRLRDFERGSAIDDKGEEEQEAVKVTPPERSPSPKKARPLSKMAAPRLKASDESSLTVSFDVVEGCLGYLVRFRRIDENEWQPIARDDPKKLVKGTVMKKKNLERGVGHVFAVKPGGDLEADWGWSPSSATFTPAAPVPAPAPAPAPAPVPDCVTVMCREPQTTAGSEGQVLKSQLLPSQLAAASIAIDGGKNIFLTGPAGTGKSFVLRWIIQELKKKHNRSDSVAVTGSTGMAALQVGGQTLHSFAGVGLGNKDAETLLEDLSNAAKFRWNSVSSLVIDEISMIDSALLDKLEFIARKVREPSKGTKPWGGVQLIFVGDFFQLPPVRAGTHGYAFQSAAWSSAEVVIVELTEVVRQTDKVFTSLLNELRVGRCSQATLATLGNCHESIKPLPTDGIIPTKIFTTNDSVDRENNSMLAKLPGEEVIYSADDEWRPSRPQWENQQKSLLEMCERQLTETLRLKPGAQVYYTKNNPSFNLVNGSRGVVLGFSKVGSSLSRAGVDDDSEPEPEYGDENASGDGLPVVRFDNGRSLIIPRAVSFVGNKESGLSRSQIPLKLCWALTVHKSQGVTLTRASVSVANAFAEGQAYVALSRVVSLEGLWLVGREFGAHAVRANKSVVEFYNKAMST